MNRYNRDMTCEIVNNRVACYLRSQSQPGICKDTRRGRRRDTASSTSFFTLYTLSHVCQIYWHLTKEEKYDQMEHRSSRPLLRHDTNHAERIMSNGNRDLCNSSRRPKRAESSVKNEKKANRLPRLKSTYGNLAGDQYTAHRAE